MTKYILLIPIVLAVVVIYHNRNFFAIDDCLDAGGAWNYTAGICK